MKAQDVMTSPPITVRPDTPVAEIAALLIERRISGVPVVDASGRMVGIVSEGDLLRRCELGSDRQRSQWLELFVDRGAQAAEVPQVVVEVPQEAAPGTAPAAGRSRTGQAEGAAGKEREPRVR